MTTILDQMKQKVDDLSRRHGVVTKKKSELRIKLEAMKQQLVSLSTEIHAAGVDPKKLKETRDKELQELQVMIESYEKDLAQVEAALAEFEQQK
jgi:hypothetical protein